MPISTYTVLHALAVQRGNYETRIALDVLRPFNLFAFIIHDPEIHREFDRTLNKTFDQLDFETGSKLLFFALVDPPTAWLAHGSHRRYYSEINNWQIREFFDPERAVTSADKGITAAALSSRLGIPDEQLPAIVVTPDFGSEQFMWIRTCPAHVQEQLRMLGYIAERTGRTFIGENPAYDHYAQIFDQIREAHIDLCNGRAHHSLEGSLAVALTDVLSFIVAGNGRDYWLRDRASDHMAQAFRRLRDSLKREKSRFTEEHQDELDKLCLLISSLLAQLNSNPAITATDFMPIDERFLETDSNRILRTAHRVYDLFLSPDAQGRIRSISSDLPDYSPIIICLAKVFEKEINLSIVHWIRKELGISLPKYFNRPQPGVTARFLAKVKGRPVDFNSARGDRWLPPALGQSQFACREISQSKTPPYFQTRWFNSNWKLMLDEWDQIKSIRNRAAHDDLTGCKDLMLIKGSLEELAKHKVFEILYRLKTEYRGGLSNNTN